MTYENLTILSHPLSSRAWMLQIQFMNTSKSCHRFALTWEKEIEWHIQHITQPKYKVMLQFYISTSISSVVKCSAVDESLCVRVCVTMRLPVPCSIHHSFLRTRTTTAVASVVASESTYIPFISQRHDDSFACFVCLLNRHIFGFRLCVCDNSLPRRIMRVCVCVSRISRPPFISTVFVTSSHSKTLPFFPQFGPHIRATWRRSFFSLVCLHATVTLCSHHEHRGCHCIVFLHQILNDSDANKPLSSCRGPSAPSPKSVYAKRHIL